MKFYLVAKSIDLESGDQLICIINNLDAEQYGVGLNAGDRVEINWNGLEKPLIVTIDTSTSIVKEGEIGIYRDIFEKYHIPDGEVITVKLLDKPESLGAIKKKLTGGKLNYQDFYSIMRDITDGKLSDILTSFYIAAGYSPGFDIEEIKLMTKALAMTGDILKFPGIVADKHSIGGVAGKGVTPIVVPIIAANDIIVPNTSTRAITSGSATTDMLEVIMPMSFEKRELENFIDEIGAFMVWGGGLDLAPADDEIIKIQKFLGIESIDKFVSSILAKKIAQGVNHVVFDVPVGKGAKIHSEEFDEVKDMFEMLGKEFGINVFIYKRDVSWIDGNAVGPSLECMEFLKIYEQSPDRSEYLERVSLEMAGLLLEGINKAPAGKGYELAKETLVSGKAHQKLKDIIRVQGGDPDVTSKSLELGGMVYEYKAKKSGTLVGIDNKRIFEVAKALGNPRIKEAGIYLEVQANQEVKAGDILARIYATSDIRLELGKKVIEQDKVFIWQE